MENLTPKEREEIKSEIRDNLQKIREILVFDNKSIGIDNLVEIEKGFSKLNNDILKRDRDFDENELLEAIEYINKNSDKFTMANFQKLCLTNELLINAYRNHYEIIKDLISAICEERESKTNKKTRLEKK